MLPEFTSAPESAAPPSFEEAFSAAWPPHEWADVTVVVAVSGGADSVALLRAMAATRSPGRGRLVGAHFNHGLRGSASDGDAEFVQELCRSLDLPCASGGAERQALAESGTGGLEAAAREARYAFLRQTADQVGARYVATAHTADDQAETVLHRILRGTGIQGLSGISRARPLSEATTLLRPLLGFRRRDLTDYLHHVGQGYREDASNADLRFTRNRIRHDLLPKLAEEYNRGVADALVRLGRIAEEAQEVIDDLASQLCAEAVRAVPNGMRIDASRLASSPVCLIRQTLIAAWRDAGWPMQAMGLAEWEMLAGLIAACAADRPDCVQRVLPGAVTAEVRDGALLLTRHPAGR